MVDHINSSFLTVGTPKKNPSLQTAFVLVAVVDVPLLVVDVTVAHVSIEVMRCVCS